MTSTRTGDIGAQSLTDEVIRSFDGTPNARTKTILTSLVRHLHDFVRDIEPSLPEWDTAIEFLTAVGQKCDTVRQEFVLLSDVLGVSMLVETINDQHAPGATDSTVLGPFHMTESPSRQLGATIDEVGIPQSLLVTGTVRGTDGHALPHATVDVWQCNEEGFYDVQQPETQPAGNGRGLFTTDEQGRFWFRTVPPSHYPIPTDGPVGALLTATDRHPYRPAHIHFIAHTDRYRPLTTHIFLPGSPYLDSDAVFAVKQSLVGDLGTVDADKSQHYGVDVGSAMATVDLILAPEPAGGPDAH
ncbi:MAG: 6-chlorohydroxyquinol-1,2-dioxygenase [Comamonadaceae bacterium]|nr:MAG: 6-chlorohydroxyquinol-1,2-dioxygenase [Comamonadaceae bacterium]